MVPVRDGPKTAASPLKCGHHVALPVPRKENPKETTQGGWEGAKHHTRVHQDSKPVSPFLCVHLSVWLPHRESCELSCGKSADFLPEELQGRGLPGDLLHACTRPSPRGASGKRPPWGPSKPVLGVVPVGLEKYRSGAVAHRANSR